ncbi:hypothetical protein CBR_g24027 [Chara braunii]|uniref:Reverse transcriptase domain-containing protein n=1 Tax=Chara braunii TaxID=69332 RepID=A0A388L5K5_CHABU|nr:hypothetical protein CBR_g24027 [Chara braunii]|eukprot:GBG77580.1 hypothetical protein CBR_g24027 [Chara braunii]
MSEEELEVLRAQLDDLLDKGWIRPSCLPYGAPVIFVRKKNKDLHLCIDYRKLNAQTVKNVSPLPRIDDLLEQLGGATYFSKLDLKSGYHQIEIQPQDRYKNTFKTWYGHFEWVVMPFGLTNAPTTFQAAMTMEFQNLLDRSVLIYLDDILVYSRTLNEHFLHLRVVLDRLRAAKYKANRDKCEFAKQEFEYLGHYVTPKGIHPLADKIQAIVDWPELRCTTDVRSFMGLAGYYQRFVESYSKVAAPLSRLQSPKVPFEFDDAAHGAFNTLKATMQDAPALRIYDPTLPTQVTTDASGEVEDEDWVEKLGFHTELPAETDAEREAFIGKLASCANKEGHNLVLEEKRSELHNRLLAQKRKEYDEKKRLKEEGERLQKALREQKGQKVDVKDTLTLLTDTLLHTTLELNALHKNAGKIEQHQEEFHSTWNNFLNALSHRIDKRILDYVHQLDELFTHKMANTIAAGKVDGGGGAGDGGDDGDDDKKGKGPRKDDRKKEGDKSEGGERREKIKVNVPRTYWEEVGVHFALGGSNGHIPVGATDSILGPRTNGKFVSRGRHS